MTINLSQLQELMSPLAQLCKKEKEVDISGIKVTLRHLNPKEEIEVQKLLPSIQDENVSGVEFADVFRRETLCRCIVQVGDLDLREIKEIETGETLPNGTPIKISKAEAVNQVIDSWSRPVINKLFEHYGVLSEEIEKEMDESLILNVTDTELEKENLQDRITNLDRTEQLNGVSSGEEVP